MHVPQFIMPPNNITSTSACCSMMAKWVKGTVRAESTTLDPFFFLGGGGGGGGGEALDKSCASLAPALAQDLGQERYLLLGA